MQITAGNLNIMFGEDVPETLISCHFPKQNTHSIAAHLLFFSSYIYQTKKNRMNHRPVHGTLNEWQDAFMVSTIKSH